MLIRLRHDVWIRLDERRLTVTRGKPLIGGTAQFEIGWGLAGFCPGPALAAIASLQPKVLIFLLALVVGMMAAKVWQNRQSAVKA